jgi:hypothetical protein
VYLRRVVEGLLYEVSRTAALSMLLTGLFCLCTGMIAILATLMPGAAPRAERAYRLTRVWCVAGGVLALVAASTGICYRWMTGDLDMTMFLVVEAGLLIVAAVWAVVTAALLLPARRRHSR